MAPKLGKNILFAATAISVAVYLIWRAFYTLPFEYGMASLVVSFLLLASEIVAGFEAVQQYLNMAHFKEPELPVIPTSWYPDVDVFITTHNEETDVVYKTANACTHMDYPDKSKVHIYICDDLNRPAMRELADSLGVGYCGLSGNTQAKAGNLNNALGLTTSPLVASFDADMIPQHDFLMLMIPYFFLPRVKKDGDGNWRERPESEIGPNHAIVFIQSPQSFYNADLFQYNLYAERRVPNEQDYFFREINVGRNRSNSSLFVGSNAVIARQALVDVGGFAINTITEDFETGLRIQAEGYTTYALATPLAHGLAPHSIPGLIAQRDRWGRWCIQSLRNTGLLFKKGLTWAAKISYLSCLIYWWTFLRRFIYIVTPILSVFFNLHVVDCTLAQILVFWLPYYFLSNQTLRILSGSTRNQHWNNLIDTTLFPYQILPIIGETLGIRRRIFAVTKKERDDDEEANSWYFAAPHIFLFVASLAAIAIAILYIIENATLYNIIIIFWLIVNSKNLFFGACFMLGRKNFRKADRFFVRLPVNVVCNGRSYEGVTTDISETGLAVLLQFPVFIPNDEVFTVQITTDRYQSRMHCEVVHVDPPDKEGHGWRYCLHIAEMDEENRRSYYQIVFDRAHTLPDRIAGRSTLYDDFSLNIDKRLNTALQSAIRKLPRIPVGVRVESTEGGEVYIQDFNYKFMWLQGAERSGDAAFGLEVAPDVVIEVEKVSGTAGIRKAKGLYRVLNLDRLLDNPRYEEVIVRWVENHRAATAAAIQTRRISRRSQG